MKNITVMKNNTSNTPVGDGELARENNHPIIGLNKNIEKYCTPEYCLSCAYFQQTKGNFGRCTVLKNDKKYDGSKKDSSCNCYRLDSGLIDLVTRPKSVPKKTEFELKVEEHNQKLKQRVKIKQIQDQQVKKHKHIFMDTYRGLPFKMTSTIKSIKKIYRSKYPYSIIKYAVELMKHDTLSSMDISREIKKKYNISVSHVSIRRWAKRYLPNKHWYIRNGSHRQEIREKISQSVIETKSHKFERMMLPNGKWVGKYIIGSKI